MHCSWCVLDCGETQSLRNQSNQTEFLRSTQVVSGTMLLFWNLGKEIWVLSLALLTFGRWVARLSVGVA